MKITASATTSVSVTASTQSKPAVAAEPTKVAAETKAATGFKHIDEFRPGPGGCFPPFKPQDAGTRNTQGKQLNEIADGVRDGSLTAKESEALLKEQKAIADYQQKAMADGRLSTEEKLRLAVMQSRADLNIHKATHNSQRDVFAPLKQSAQRQADQIDRVAEGRKNGNITNTEAGELIGDQADISQARQNTGGLFGNFAVNQKLNQADREINYHSKPGTQWDIKPFPFPRPEPRPLPFPRPEPRPLPWPELPRPMPLPFPRQELPTKPDFHILPFKGVING